MSASSRRPARSTRWRPDVTVVLAVVLPLVTGGAVLLTGTEPPSAPGRPPTETALSAVSLVCPPGRSGPTPTLVTSGAGGSGRLEVAGERVRVRAGEVAAVDTDDGPVVVEGQDGLAPGLVASRFDEQPLAATECRAPAPEQWFTGAGAAAGHSSVIELVNPDNGPAIVDVVVTGRSGVVDVPALRGVSVPGGEALRLDLAEIVPRRDELALRVTTQRGRVHASVLDTVDELGAGVRAQEWLSGQAEPQAESTLLGLPAGPGARTLLLANPGDSEVRAAIRVVGEQSVFTPEGMKEVRVGPQSVERVDLGVALAGVARDGAIGLQVSATAPVTATLRSFVGGDLSHAVPAGAFAGPTTALVPPGTKRLLVTGAESTGAVEIVAQDASGEELASRRVGLTPDRGFAVDLPDGTVRLTVTPERTPVVAAVLAGGDGGGTSVVRLRELVLSGLVPAVRPGLPAS
ncbi:DUF5719 family protein [Nocardioides sp. SYSU DS0663]|uniref:DUF5719 family protein n=1 Tax=Nocardioides sp. SYSU DS0663 TaxID=3416445 RepID=UPI003F4B6C42